MNRVGILLKRNRSFSFLDVGSFLLKFLVTYVTFGASLYLSTLLSLPQGEKFTSQRWMIVLIGSLLLVAFTYAREMFVMRKKEQRIRGGKLIYDCIGGAIEQLSDIRTCAPGEASRFINELLKYVEKVVVWVLHDWGLQPGEICANLMIKKSAPDRLELDFFGTFLHGRTKLVLELDPSHLVPGAPEAYHHRKTMYVPNTMSGKYRRFFDESKPYRSIVSVPIDNGEDSIFAVLNIDSDIPAQFMSQDFISKQILPALSPFIALFKLERDLVVSE